MLRQQVPRQEPERQPELLPEEFRMLGYRPSRWQASDIVRIRHHQPTRDYVARRSAEGLSKREIIRCLKRYIAREIYANLPRPSATSSPSQLALEAA